MANAERWRWIPGYEGRYKVSSLGRIFSYAKAEPTPLRQTINPQTGYPSVSLYMEGGNRERKQVCTHWAVMRAFVGPCPEGQETRHLDGNRTNPRLSNLEYGTKLENEEDKQTHGTRVRGETVGSAVLTEKQVVRIKISLAGKVKVKALAQQFGVHEQTIYAIKQGRVWKHVGVNT